MYMYIWWICLWKEIGGLFIGDFVPHAIEHAQIETKFYIGDFFMERKSLFQKLKEKTIEQNS